MTVACWWVRASLACMLVAAASSTVGAEPSTARPWTRPVIHAEGKGLTNSDGTLRVFPDPVADELGWWLVLDYNAFGPQAMAATLLGMSWYAFNGGCQCGEPGDQFDVRVVVYQPGALNAAKRLFVSGATTGDYRFVSVAAARRYVAASLAELRAFPAEDRLHALEGQLESLRATLVRWFPKASR